MLHLLRTILFFPEADAGGSGGGDGGGNSDGAQDGGGGGKPPEGDGASSGSGGDEGDGDDKPLSQAEARKLRSEAQNLRKRLKEAETKGKELEDRDLSDQEKLRRDLEERSTRLSTVEEDNRSLRVQVLASKVGIRPDAAATAAGLIDWSSIDDSSDSKKVEKALRALREDHAYLFGGQSGVDGGARGDDGGTGAGDMNDRLRRAVGIGN